MKTIPFNPQKSIIAPLPAGYGIMRFTIDNRELDICVSRVMQIEYYSEATKAEKKPCAKIIYNGDNWVKSFGYGGIQKVKDMYARALRGEIASTSEYNDDGYRKDGTLLVEDKVRLQNTNICKSRHVIK
jgi:hypothetical protein